METTRIKLTIAYDGTRYQGWQCQNVGTGVQQLVEEALAKLIPGGPHHLHSSSRTDTGVHALGMVAHVDLPLGQTRITPQRLRPGINAFLPPDIRVLASSRVKRAWKSGFTRLDASTRMSGGKNALMPGRSRCGVMRVLPRGKSTWATMPSA